MTSFDAPGAGVSGTMPTAINSQGEIAGSANNYTVAFLRGIDGTIVDLDLPCAQRYGISSIDNAGRILGSCILDGGSYQAFYGDPQSGYVRFSLPESMDTSATGIDTNGDHRRLLYEHGL